MKNRSHVAIVLFTLLVCSHAWAGPVLDSPIRRDGRVGFGNKKDHYAVTGSGIKITDLIFGSENLRLINDDLTFTTGERNSRSSAGDWIPGQGGKFTIRGCANLGGNRDAACNKKDLSGILMTGTFLSTKLLKEKNGETILIATFLEQINPQLAKFLKLPSTTSEGTLTLELAGGAANWQWVRGGQMQAFPTLPEPASILLLLPCLLCLAVRRFV